ncbi:hypothetical protein EV188_110146 [Actinomycetospora succinea]|uniref:DUF262 domain-containing protein n=1 Tax=Actinomycetospora succinea TaxID=663603 RepID=A0A4R6UVZ6_9PSEU|nr:DUF262 domain-containing protein [Actinomycetospora succinea]TDQ50149.1 hypothetical protein EV188_110146 [Actinomycetospora succinea]
MHLDHAVVEAEVLLTRIASGEIETGWDADGGWDRRRQQLLVDTVLRNWPIPPVVIASDDESDVLLDGRERLRTLWRFTRDEVPVAGTTPAAGEYLEQLDGLLFSQLPERFRRRVRRYGVPVVRVPGHADGEVRELMSRWDPTTPAYRAAAPVPAPAAPAPPAITPPPAVPPPPPPPAAPVAPRLPAAREPGESFRPVETSPPDRSAGAHRRSSDAEPIFDELSAWFLEGTSEAPTWSSPADSGHEAARAALRESTVELTPAGLPIRQPSARLAPGAVQAPARARPGPTPDPHTVGEHLNRFREGASAARNDLSPPA